MNLKRDLDGEITFAFLKGLSIGFVLSFLIIISVSISGGFGG